MLRRLIAPTLFAVFAGQAATAADLTALRYYASLGQKDRVLAETLRLQKLEPGFQPPDDLFTARPGRADEEPLWALYAQGRLDDIDAAIALRKKAEPDWQPSEDLAVKMRTKRLRATIMALAASGEWRPLLRSFATTGIAWARDDAEALWVIAEAY
ncbi:MAG: hypothetical protein INR64_19880, partial [Caulobacteraceae bacterium]|nr:hypothetical protein [Caulobacter sp.]